MNNYRLIVKDSYFAHHGIPGMHWRIRRFQNPDGTLTPAGRARYLKSGTGELTKKGRKAAKKNPYILKESENAKNEYRKDAVERGNLKFVLKNEKDYSNEEIQNAINRYDKVKLLASKVSELDSGKIEKGTKFLDRMSKILTSATNATNSAVDFGEALKKGTKFLDELDNAKKKQNKLTKKDLDKMLNDPIFKDPNKYSKQKIEEASNYIKSITNLRDNYKNLYNGSSNQNQNQSNNSKKKGKK